MFGMAFSLPESKSGLWKEESLPDEVMAKLREEDEKDRGLKRRASKDVLVTNLWVGPPSFVPSPHEIAAQIRAQEAQSQRDAKELEEKAREAEQRERDEEKANFEVV